MRCDIVSDIEVKELIKMIQDSLSPLQGGF